MMTTVCIHEKFLSCGDKALPLIERVKHYHIHQMAIKEPTTVVANVKFQKGRQTFL